ncbi:hypothetical protein OH786_24160 [Streptomyces atratus]|uniref:Uncharacterized protein n=1 Tax=Streptomyces atratus TaxID=1893 RepID=A0A1K1VSS3_STRAR|nr:hypothetical protein [Streptomyces atratus]SFX27907.1 hypothetical protein SAMN02787144_100297 [Streptomyces atratus]
MNSWESDPAYRAVVRAFVDGDPVDQVGGPFDVRAVVAGIPPGAKDGFLLEEVPWDRFPEGARVREAMERLRSGDAGAVVSGLGTLTGLCANDMRAAAALRIYAHLWPGEEDRTRSVMDAVLGGLRTGCGQQDQAIKEIAGQRA